MRRTLSSTLPVLLVAMFVVLGAASPGWAHRELSADASTELLATTPDAGVLAPTLSAAPDLPGLPWPALLCALLAGALGWRRPRRAIALAVVLLLAVFAFEEGLHSVHHLNSQTKLVRCSVAAATAHLAATTVDSAAGHDVILPVATHTTESSQTDPVARFICPDQGRAPPLTA